MSKALARRQPRRLPELPELFTDFPTWADLPALIDTQLMRLEDEMEDGHYVVRAEMPGIDPAKDVDITVRDGQLTIKAERTEKKEAKGRSEFRYGSFVRSGHCRRAPTKTTSTPPTTKASRQSRWPFPNRPCRLRSTVRCRRPADPMIWAASQPC